MSIINASLHHDEDGKPYVVSDDPRGNVGETDWDYLESMTNGEIRKNALDDPENRPSTSEERARMRLQRDYRSIRRGLQLTTEEFAERFSIALGTLQDWERGRRNADQAAKTLLYVIGDDPDLAIRAATAARTSTASAAD